MWNTFLSFSFCSSRRRFRMDEDEKKNNLINQLQFIHFEIGIDFNDVINYFTLVDGLNEVLHFNDFKSTAFGYKPIWIIYRMQYIQSQSQCNIRKLEIGLLPKLTFIILIEFLIIFNGNTYGVSLFHGSAAIRIYFDIRN